MTKQAQILLWCLRRLVLLVTDADDTLV